MRKRTIAAIATVVAVVTTVAIVGVSFTSDGVNNRSQSSPKRLSYIALGDSVAAGIGLANYSDPSACNRTDQSYPQQLSNKNNYNLTNIACSGATISSGLNGVQTVNNLAVGSQLDALFALPKAPDVVTLTIGANDINWTQFAACYAIDCPVSAQQAQLGPSLSTMTQNLAGALDRLAQKYTQNMPKVIVTGYYQVFVSDNTVNCENTDGLDKSELEQARAIVNGLNDSIERTVAKYKFVRFATIDFANHELCSDEPWIQGLADKAPFHPTEAGQSAIARQLTSVIKSY